MLAQLGVTGFALALSYGFAFGAIRNLARYDTGYKTLADKRAVVVVREGATVNVVMVSLDSHIRNEGAGHERFDVLPGPEPRSLKTLARKLFLMGGIRLMGIPHLDKAKLYPYVTTTFHEEGGGRGRPSYVIERRTELMDYIPMQAEVEPFVVHVSFADGTSVYVVVLARIEKQNPYLMVTDTSHWWETVRQVIVETSRGVMAQYSYQSLLKNEEAIRRQIEEKLKASENIQRSGIQVPRVGILVADIADTESAKILRLAFEGTERAKAYASIAEGIDKAGPAGLAAAMFESMRQGDGRMVFVGRDISAPVIATVP